MGIVAVSGSSIFLRVGDSSIDSKDGFKSIFPPSIVPLPVGEAVYFSLFKFLVLKADN